MMINCLSYTFFSVGITSYYIYFNLFKKSNTDDEILIKLKLFFDDIFLYFLKIFEKNGGTGRIEWQRTGDFSDFGDARRRNSSVVGCCCYDCVMLFLSFFCFFFRSKSPFSLFLQIFSPFVGFIFGCTQICSKFFNFLFLQLFTYIFSFTE